MMTIYRNLGVVCGGLFLGSMALPAQEEVFTSTESTHVSEPTEGSLSKIVSQRVDVESDFFYYEDISVYRGGLAYEVELEELTIGGTLGYQRHEIDYDPNLTTNPLERSEENFQASISLGRSFFSDSLDSTVTLSGYQGFTDYRSLWISEFFRQFFGLFPEYEEADPYGWSIALSNSWGFANGVDRLTLDLGYSRDRIAPGWEIGGPRFNQAERTNDLLETFSGSLTLDLYITSKIKSQHFIRLAQVTDRELRTQLRTNWAWAFFGPLTAKFELGATYEPTAFESYYGGASLIYQILPELEANLGWRIYTDSGEITSTNFNSAAPRLDSRDISLSLRWTRDGHSVSAAAGFYQTDFAPSEASNTEFANLYNDRDFLTFRTAYSRVF